jgi:hypothetical protein
MPDNVTGPVAEQSRVRELLEQVLDSGSSLEDACRDSPELLPQVRKRWEQLRVIQAQVGALFPAPESTPGPGITPPVRPVVELPQLPGYDVQGMLGRGGMGIVFKAWHVRLHRPVALSSGPARRVRHATRSRLPSRHTTGSSCQTTPPAFGRVTSSGARRRP